MSDPNVSTHPWSRAPVADPGLPPAALAGVRSRRVFALLIDAIFISILCFGLWLTLGLLSFGFLWMVLPPMQPAVALLYNGFTVSGWRHATPGMRALDLEVRLVDGAPTPFLNAAAHAVLYYVSWTFPLVFIVTLFSTDKRYLHDMLAGVVVTRRLPQGGMALPGSGW